MFRDFSKLRPAEIYHLMIQTIVPRPIAWVLSDSGEGRLNLAPFSYFTGITSSPPLCMISVGHKADGSRKDTWRNIEEREDFVVHIGSRAHAEVLTATAASLAHGESELDSTGLETVVWEGSRLPRLATAKVALGCTLHRIVELGSGPQAAIFGEIYAAYLDDSIVELREGRVLIHTQALDPLARLGGDDYGSVGQVFEVPRP